MKNFAGAGIRTHYLATQLLFIRATTPSSQSKATWQPRLAQQLEWFATVSEAGVRQPEDHKAAEERLCLLRDDEWDSALQKLRSMAKVNEQQEKLRFFASKKGSASFFQNSNDSYSSQFHFREEQLLYSIMDQSDWLKMITWLKSYLIGEVLILYSEFFMSLAPGLSLNTKQKLLKSTVLPGLC